MKHTGKESSIGLEVNMTGEPYARFIYSISDSDSIINHMQQVYVSALTARRRRLFGWTKA